MPRTNIGELGEEIVAQWLEQQGWLILYRRWRCRWGEIDLIARSRLSEVLIFVEVKTRGDRNWDADGLLSVTSQKQAKISQTAQLFLARSPNLADFSCRFDVALVSYKQNPQLLTLEPEGIKIGKPISWKGYQFILHNYIESSFDCR
jgi:putative endonuclease